MTLGNMLTQMGIGTKQLNERYADFAQPSHDQHVIYGYEHSQPPHDHVAYSKHSHGGGNKSNAAMSALTLLAFLFFLHILQQCLKDHMNTMQTPQIMVITGGRDGDVDLAKRAQIKKLDKSGNIEPNNELNESQTDRNKKHDGKNIPYDETENKYFTKISTAEKTPKIESQKYIHYFKSYVNRSSEFPQYVTDFNEDK